MQEAFAEQQTARQTTQRLYLSFGERITLRSVDAVAPNGEPNVHVVKIEMPEQENNEGKRREQRRYVSHSVGVNRVEGQQHCE